MTDFIFLLIALFLLGQTVYRGCKMIWESKQPRELKTFGALCVFGFICFMAVVILIQYMFLR